MAEKRYSIIFNGKLTPGANPAEVLANISKLLNLEVPQVRELFKPGAGAVIRQEMEGQNAYRLRDLLQEAGVDCNMQEVAASTESPAPLDGLRPGEAQPRQPDDRRPQTQRRPAQRPLPQERHTSPASSSASGILSMLFKLIVLAAIGGGGWWGYQSYLAPPTPAYEAYVLYSESMAREQYQKAAEAASGQAKERADNWIRMSAPSTMKVYGREFSTTPPSVSSIAGEIAWIKRKRKSEKKSDNGGVILQVEETVCRIPPGVSSAICKWPVTFRQDVEVTQDSGSWKVSSFKDERLTPQE